MPDLSRLAVFLEQILPRIYCSYMISAIGQFVSFRDLVRLGFYEGWLYLLNLTDPLLFELLTMSALNIPVMFFVSAPADTYPSS